MKLRKLHIEDYKMFKDFDIDFLDEKDNPLDVVVLAGVNGSGKTTLLDSLGKTKKEQYLLKLGSYTTIEIRENDNIEFTYDNLKQDLNLNVPNKFFILYADNIVYFSAGIDDTKKVADEFVKTFYFFLKEKDYRPSEITEYFNQYMKDIFNDLDIGFKYSHLDKEDTVWFTSDDSDGYYYTHKDNKEKVLFSIDELSTGQKTLLSKILYIYFKDYKDKVILIDEPELSLHPKWQNQVLSVYEKLAEKNNCQIIIATHSPHIIGSAKAESIRLLKKENNTIKVVDNFSRSYGLEFDKILTEIMGVENLRTPDVAKDIKKLWKLLEDENYESEEYKELYLRLEKDLGDLDKDMVLSRLEIARIKSRNAKS